MSIRAVAWALSALCPTPLAKLVLIKLADCANEEGECWPSQARIAADCGVTRKTVNYQLKVLAEADLLRAEQRVGKHGKQANHYFLRCNAATHSDVTPALHPDVTTGSQPIEPSLEPSEPPLNPPQGGRVSVKTDFAEFWLAYPHKVGKADAERKYLVARKAGATQAELLDGIGRYKRTKPDDHNWCNPATWLHQQRWLDQPAGAGPLFNGHDPAPPRPAIDPKRLGHSLPCACSNCMRWVQQQQEA